MLAHDILQHLTSKDNDERWRCEKIPQPLRPLRACEARKVLPEQQDYKGKNAADQRRAVHYAGQGAPESDGDDGVEEGHGRDAAIAGNAQVAEEKSQDNGADDDGMEHACGLVEVCGLDHQGPSAWRLDCCV